MSFTDDFVRANGPLGSNWSPSSVSYSVTGNRPRAATSTNLVCLALSSAGPHDASVTIDTSIALTAATRVIVKSNDGGTQSYGAALATISGGTYVTINKGTQLGGIIAQVLIPTGLPNPSILRLTYSQGILSAYLNGVMVLFARDSDYDVNTRVGFSLPTTTQNVVSFTTSTAFVTTFTVSPNWVQTSGAPIFLYLSGYGTSWVAGTPGTPTFSASAGSLSGQQVGSPSTASVYFTPPTTDQTVIITDPSTGLTASVVVSATAPTGGGSQSTLLSATAIDYIERSAIAETGGTIVNRQEVVTVGGISRTLSETVQTITSQVSDPTEPTAGVGSLLAFVIQIFDLINGGGNWGGAATVFGNTSLIKSGVDDANTAISDMRGAGGVTLATLAAALSDLRGVGQPSLADVLSAISTPDLGPISDKLDAMRGDTTTSLYTLLSSLAGIRSTHAYSLEDVLDAIGDPAQVSSPATAVAVVALVAALALAAPTGGASVAAAAVAVGAGPVLDIATIVELVGVLGELASIGADVAALAARPSGGYIGAPVWPGASGASVGDAQALSDGLIVTGPLDGLIVAVTGHPAGAGKYSFGSVTSWQHCGAVVFESDRGDYERAESFGLASQLVVPRTMAHAASAVVRLNGGWSGTVRKWSATA